MLGKHHHRFYRIIAITLAFVVFGAAILVPIGVQNEGNKVLIFVLLGVWAFLLVGTIVANELIIKFKYGGDFLKKGDEDDNRKNR